jgi:predicted lipid-binding transport protein (Tim44 family)
MSEGFAYLDIIFFAMVAAFIAFRLRNVLGRRTGHERRRPTSIGTRPSEARPETVASRDEAKDAAARPEDAPVADMGDRGLKAGLTQLRLADPNFTLEGFLDGARAAFAMIVEAFSKGEKEALRPLLAEDVYNSFAAAIDERAAQARTLSTELVSIKAAELAGAAMQGTVARVTVKFVSDQINVVRDAEGGIVEGDPGTTEEIVDLWTFARDTRSHDPNWALVETRSPEA